MNCLINDIIRTSISKGKKVDVVRRYLKMKYHTNIDRQSLERRIQGLKSDIRLA